MQVAGKGGADAQALAGQHRRECNLPLRMAAPFSPLRWLYDLEDVCTAEVEEGGQATAFDEARCLLLRVLHASFQVEYTCGWE